MFVVTVVFEIAPDRVEAFRDAVDAQAAASLTEAGCHRFDVSEDVDRGRVLLYELYADAGAFDLHLATPHFAHFDAAVRDWVLAKTVDTWQLRGDPGEPGA